MHLAYSALRNTDKKRPNKKAKARYSGYLAACKKHQQMIAEIQAYLPGWQPPFSVSNY